MQETPYIHPRRFSIHYFKDKASIVELLTPSDDHDSSRYILARIKLDDLVSQLKNNRGINPETGLRSQISTSTGYTFPNIEGLVSKDTLQPIQYRECVSDDPSFSCGTIVEEPERNNEGFKKCTPSEFADLISKIRTRFDVKDSQIYGGN